MEKYTLHFRQTDMPLAFIDLTLCPNNYGDFDYRMLFENKSIAGFLTEKGIQQTYEFGKRLLVDDFAEKIILELKEGEKNLRNLSPLEGIEKKSGSELVKKWEQISTIESKIGEYYRHCEQPMLAAVEDVLLAACDNDSDIMVKVLTDPSLADQLNFSEYQKKALDILIKLGELKFSLHNEFGPWIEFFYIIAGKIAKENYLSLDQALMIRGTELSEALKGNVPAVDVLNDRLNGCVFIPPREGEMEWQCLSGIDFEWWKNEMEHISDEHAEIRGNSVYPGKARGPVKIHLSLINSSDVPEGSVVVSGMTNPQIVPFLKNAVAIVTDEGGLTCHAAIIARELKKPCVVGTGMATQLLKDGDLVEVDADNGIVKIIEKK